MGLYIVAETGQSKQEFVSSSALGADLLTEVLVDQVAIFVGPDTIANVDEVVTGLRQCTYGRREAGVITPATLERAAASVVPGAGQAAVVRADDAVLFLETVVGVAYGEDWVTAREDSSIFLTNQVNQLIERWMEIAGKST